MIKKEWFWMSKQNKDHCHYSGLPSPMAYEKKKISKMKEETKYQLYLIAGLLAIALVVTIINKVILT
jgi:hypothetical protein